MKQKKMPPTPPTASGSQSDPVLHKIVQRNSAVIKFCGNVGTSQLADVEGFIQSVDNHLQSLGITDDVESLTEARCYFDLSRGCLKVNLQSWEFRNIKTWSECKVYLRSIYGTVIRKDPAVSLSKILRDLNSESGYYREFMAQTFLKLNEFVELISLSEWVEAGRKTISLENFQNLLYLALGLQYLPENLVSNVKDK